MNRSQSKSHQGKASYYAGIAAEDVVARAYCRKGIRLIAKRWRGQGGEIDLVFGEGHSRIFVEVKKSKTFSAAASRLSMRQTQRLFATAEEFLANEPLGLLTDARFDVALVNQAGEVNILENALLTN